MKHCLVALFLLGLSVCSLAQTGHARNEGSQCAAFPCVVASVSLTDQTTSVSHVPIFTPTATGLYRITYYEASSPILGSSWAFEWDWTDDFKTRNYGPFTLSRGSYFNASVPAARVLAGQPITYTITAGSHAEGTSYNLFATVEQLQ